MTGIRRAICIVLDGVGVGAAPDARAWGDEGSDSIGNTARAVGGLRLPNLEALGIGHLTDIRGVAKVAVPRASYGRLTPAAAGKDSTTGHWELMGCVLGSPLPTYPDGFPLRIVADFERQIGRRVLGNRAASGTEILVELGDTHVETAMPILYTSADSVFQLAAHEEVVPAEELYRWCAIARRILRGSDAVGRVIARPFAGSSGGYFRTRGRRDFSLEPPGETVLDRLSNNGLSTLAIGKISELFADRGISRSFATKDNRDGMSKTLDSVNGTDADFIFANLVDFDTMWGHRNDARAYALGLEEFDSFLAELLPALRDDDLLLITADHGTDPTTAGTDHSREFVPVLATTGSSRRGMSLGTRDTLADVGATVLEALRCAPAPAGKSFLPAIERR